MGIENPEIIESVKKIEELEKKLFAHPLRKVGKWQTFRVDLSILADVMQSSPTCPSLKL